MLTIRRPSDDPASWLGNEFTDIYHWKKNNLADWSAKRGRFNGLHGYGPSFSWNPNGNGFVYVEDLRGFDKGDINENQYLLHYRYKDFPMSRFKSPTLNELVSTKEHWERGGLRLARSSGATPAIACAVSINKCNNTEMGAGLFFEDPTDPFNNFYFFGFHGLQFPDSNVGNTYHTHPFVEGPVITEHGFTRVAVGSSGSFTVGEEVTSATTHLRGTVAGVNSGRGIIYVRLDRGDLHVGDTITDTGGGSGTISSFGTSLEREHPYTSALSVLHWKNCSWGLLNPSISTFDDTPKKNFQITQFDEYPMAFADMPTSTHYLMIKRISMYSMSLYYSVDGVGWNHYINIINQPPPPDALLVRDDEFTIGCPTRFGFGYWIKPQISELDAHYSPAPPGSPTGDTSIAEDFNPHGMQHDRFGVSFDWLAHSRSITR